MTIRNHVIFWTFSFTIFIALIYIFKSVLLPFVLGATIAYLLNPLVHKFKRNRISRGTAALIIAATFFIILAALIAVLAPLLYKQALELSSDIPRYFNSLMAYIDPYSQQILKLLGQDTDANLKDIITDQSSNATGIAKKILLGLAVGGQAIFSAVSVIIISPIVAYFVMKEWVHITAWIEDLLPKDHKQTILRLLGKIDTKLSGFVRGQISVAAILGVAYAIALSLAGLNYGFLIGLGAGLVSIIPMVGSTLGLLVSITVAWFQSGDIAYVGIIGAIFLIGQLIEGNILSPKIVGESVGMHPLWVFFALMAGGSLFGILGMLIAVPVAASAGVLISFAIEEYKESPYYKASTKTQKIKAPDKEKPKAKAKTA